MGESVERPKDLQGRVLGTPLLKRRAREEGTRKVQCHLLSESRQRTERDNCKAWGIIQEELPKRLDPDCTGFRRKTEDSSKSLSNERNKD